MPMREARSAGPGMAGRAFLRGRGDESVAAPLRWGVALRARDSRFRVRRVREGRAPAAGRTAGTRILLFHDVRPGSRRRLLLRLPVAGRAVCVRGGPRRGRVGAVAGGAVAPGHGDVLRVAEFAAGLAAGRGGEGNRQKNDRKAPSHRATRPPRQERGYLAASRMISSITASTSRAVVASVGSLNIWSIAVGLIVSSTTSLPSA